MNEFIDGDLTLDEMMKIISLLENPKAAENVRKALRFYEIPDNLRDPINYKWGENANLMKILFHYSLPQSSTELDWMLKHLEGKDSLLEIGSSFGGTLKKMASVLQRGAKIVSVDLPIDSTPKFLNPQASLKETCRQISLMGGNVELFMGNSHSEKVRQAVEEFGPYDFVFIDGDHSYEGVKQDWKDYGPMGRMVGFHDIGGPVEGCSRLWAEIKAEGYRTEECISKNGNLFGIGIVFKD